MAKKQGPLYLIAREFIEHFPGQQPFGVAATERQLEKVMREIGCDPAQLLWRVRQWARTRRNLAPWQLVKPPPGSPIKEETKPVRRPVTLEPVPDSYRQQVLWIYQPWEEDLP